jgi:hypothetical protein
MVFNDIQQYFNYMIWSVLLEEELHRWCYGYHACIEWTWSWVDSRSGQTNDYYTAICFFSAKYAALRRKSNDWLARNQDNVSEWSDMSTDGLFSELVP